MKLATTTADFESYTPIIEEQIQHIHSAGFKNIDLNLYVVNRHPDLFYSDGWRERAKQINDFCNTLGVSLVQSHGPNVNFLAESGVEHMIDDTIRCIDICGELGIPNTVVHPGFSLELTDDKKYEWFKINREFFRELIPAMERNGVKVLIENSTKANVGPRYFTNSGADMREFCEYLDHPLFGCCWDTGHANCEGLQYDEIMAIGDKLCALHFNDNTGHGDDHVLPYCGTMNLDDIMHGLIDSGYRGYLTFEAGSTLRPFHYWRGNRRDTDKEKKLSEPTIAMQDAAEKLMYEIGKHVLTTYNLFEE